VCALELGRLGVTANCLAPVAVTRLVAPLMGGEENISDEIKEAIGPRWIAAVATWLASPAAAGVTGRTFEVRGDKVSVAEGWHGGPAGPNSGEPAEVGEVIQGLLTKARPNADLEGQDDPARFTVG
jgi:NAD(P)-dependent dehydrogenase (short-subunit alcohol dehydrogenase family)